MHFFGYVVMKALNAIYGIYNLKLKEEEIKFIMEKKEKLENEEFN